MRALRLSDNQGIPFALQVAHISVAVVVALGCGFLLAWLCDPPRPPLARARGLYPVEQGRQPFRWTSTHVDLLLPPDTRLVELTLRSGRWPARPTPTLLALATDGYALAAFPVDDAIRRYHLLLPPLAASLRLETSVARPPGDQRWLGVQLLDMRLLPRQELAWPSARMLAVGMLAAVVLVASAWLTRPYLPAARLAFVGLTVVALGLRLFDIASLPPGFGQDELVSIVDAWHLARSGHDHRGNLMPLGAFEAFGDWISPLLTYLELLPVAVFGPHPLIGRLLAAFCGALVVPLLAGLARQVGLPPVGALCAALVVALSPWLVSLGRVAMPPALVPLCWTLCLWAAHLLTQRGDRRAAILLALAGGLSLYSYPTMKLAVPLLVGWATLLALARHGRYAARAWLPAALLLLLLWLPFVAVTLLNPLSAARINEVGLQADSAGAWLRAWGRNYAAYVAPGFFFGPGDQDRIHGPLAQGVQLTAEIPLVMAGLVALELRITDWQRVSDPVASAGGWLLVGALLIAPLPASLTQPGQHAYRAATLAPLYALLAGLGAAALWSWMRELPWGRIARRLGAIGLVALLAWQSGLWFQRYLREYPPTVAGLFFYQDGLLETMERAVSYAPEYDEVWIAGDLGRKPLIYLLAAQPLPPVAAQAALRFSTLPDGTRDLSAIGRYRLVAATDLPPRAPPLELVLNRFGTPVATLEPAIVAGRRVLIIRGG